MKKPRPSVKTSRRPSTPDGRKYLFNCCASSDVWLYDDEEYRCKSCGHNWTEELTKDNTE